METGPSGRTRPRSAEPRNLRSPPGPHGTSWLRRLGILVAALVLLGLGLWAGTRRGGETIEAFAQLAERVEALDASLAREQQERAALAREVSRLQAALEQERSQEQQLAPPGRSVLSAAPAPEVASRAVEAPVAADVSAPSSPRFDERRLRGSRIAPADVERYRAGLARIELDRLRLRDRAAREGWLDTPRFAAESQRVDEELARLDGEFDDDFHDWLRYASGQPNRLAVTEVLPDSPAAAAGLQVGDLLVRYDGNRLLEPESLREATAAGLAGDWADVEVQRGSESLRLRVPRGPLGVAIDQRSVAPAPNGN